jgi:hypothetical protein
MYKQNQTIQDTYTIDLAINCPKRRCEVMLDDVTTAECLVEDLCSQTLISLFDTVLMDEVSITFNESREAPISIVLRAQGIEPLRSTQNLDIIIEEKLTCALTEIFDTLHVEHCTML